MFYFLIYFPNYNLQVSHVQVQSYYNSHLLSNVGKREKQNWESSLKGEYIEWGLKYLSNFSIYAIFKLEQSKYLSTYYF